MGIVIGLLVLVLVLLTLFVGFVLPFIAIVHCAQNRELSDSGRIIWILAVLFFWSFAAILYMATHKYKVRILYSAFALGSLLFLTLGAFIGALNKTGDLIVQGAHEMDFKSAAKLLSKQEVEFLQKGTNTLALEFRNSGVFNFRTKMINITILDLAKLYVEDKDFTPEEYKTWKGLYDLRFQLDEKKLLAFAQDAKSKSLQKREPSSQLTK